MRASRCWSTGGLLVDAGYAGCARIDAALFTHPTKHRAVHGVVRLAQDLVDVLVRHLVLEHLHQHSPTVIEQQAARELDYPQAAVPAAQTRARVDELERRTRELKTEQSAIQIFPGADNGVQARRARVHR